MDENVVGTLDEKYVQYSLEKLITDNPDIYLTGKGCMGDPQAIEEQDGWQDLTAVERTGVCCTREGNIPGWAREC